MMTKMQFQESELFGDKIISTISYNQQEIINNILYLYNNKEMVELDPTYSKGNFYKGYSLQPKYKFDKFPYNKEIIKATTDNLPIKNETIKSIMFDPPFVISGEGWGENIKCIKKASGIISKKFTAFKNWDELKNMYSSSMKEFYRILMPFGILIFKCQDTVAGGLNYFSHTWIMNKALEIGFSPKDLFILLSKNRLNDGRKQQHARKFHCYFWVFKKEKCKINYD